LLGLLLVSHHSESGRQTIIEAKSVARLLIAVQGIQ